MCLAIEDNYKEKFYAYLFGNRNSQFVRIPGKLDIKRVFLCFEGNCFVCGIGPGLLFHEKIYLQY
jgi:hypothetical protein